MAALRSNCLTLSSSQRQATFFGLSGFWNIFRQHGILFSDGNRNGTTTTNGSKKDLSVLPTLAWQVPSIYQPRRSQANETLHFVRLSSTVVHRKSTASASPSINLPRNGSPKSECQMVCRCQISCSRFLGTTRPNVLWSNINFCTLWGKISCLFTYFTKHQLCGNPSS